jgi:hypothetical protein
MAASRMIVVVSSSDDGLTGLPEADPGPPAGAAVDAGAALVAGVAVVGAAVELAGGGTVSAGTAVLPGVPDVALPGAVDEGLPGVVELACPWPGPCAEAGRGAAVASTAQQIPAVRRRRRIRRHRVAEDPLVHRARRPVSPLIAARR